VADLYICHTITKTMRNILIIGAGRSASSLIKYLLEKSDAENLHLTIGDLSLELAQRKPATIPMPPRLHSIFSTKRSAILK
jgi:pyrroline-5-carboxylate reductase